VKRLREIGLTHSYNNHQETQTIFCALLALPLLLMADIRPAFDDVESLLMDDSPRKDLLQKLLRYVERQWVTKSTVGPRRLSVRDNSSRTNNVLQSFHSALRSRVKVAHSRHWPSSLRAVLPCHDWRGERRPGCPVQGCTLKMRKIYGGGRN